MRICIYGAGSTGGHLAVKFARAGHDVSVVARGAHLQAIRDTGLTLNTGGHSWLTHPQAADAPAALGPQDIIFVCVKATALSDVARDIGPLVTPETRVIFAQNGMPWWYPLGQDLPEAIRDIPVFRLVRDFAAHLAPEQVFGAVVYTANQVTAPGIVLNTSPDHNRIYLSAASTPDPQADATLRDILITAGVESPALPDIRERIWKKLLFNMSSSALALSVGNMSSTVRHDPELSLTFTTLVREGLQIAKAAGYDLADEMKPVDMLALLLDHRPSLLQDYEAGRPMELSEILIAPLQMARAWGLETPVLQAIAAIQANRARQKGLLA